MPRICNGSKSPVRKIQHTPRHKRTTIGDAHRHALAIARIDHAKLGAKRHPPMCRRQTIRIEPGPISSSPAVIAIPSAIMAGHTANRLSACCSSKQHGNDGGRNNCFENHERKMKNQLGRPVSWPRSHNITSPFASSSPCFSWYDFCMVGPPRKDGRLWLVRTLP